MSLTPSFVRPVSDLTRLSSSPPLAQPYRFVVGTGDSKKLFLVDRKLVDKCFRAFSVLLKGRGHQACSGDEFLLPEIDEETFAGYISSLETNNYYRVSESTFSRYSEFLETNDYTLPRCGHDLRSRRDGESFRSRHGYLRHPVDQSANSIRDISLGSEYWKHWKQWMVSKPPLCMSRPEHWVEEFEKLVGIYALVSQDPHAPLHRRPWLRAKAISGGENGKNESFGGLFMAHAQMYVFGERYMIPQLRSVARNKLCRDLYRWTPYPWQIHDLAELIQYVYRNTFPTSPLRSALAIYAAAIWSHLARSSVWQEFVANSGSDFVETVAMLIPIISVKRDNEKPPAMMTWIECRCHRQKGQCQPATNPTLEDTDRGVRSPDEDRPKPRVLPASEACKRRREKALKIVEGAADSEKANPVQESPRATPDKPNGRDPGRTSGQTRVTTADLGTDNSESRPSIF